jgi:hypothetical protein
LPFDPAIPFLGIYPKEWNTDYYRGKCTLMFIVALFTIAKLWKQLRCPTDEWIKRVYLYKMEFSQPLRGMKSYHSQTNEWSWRTSS